MGRASGPGNVSRYAQARFHNPPRVVSNRLGTTIFLCSCGGGGKSNEELPKRCWTTLDTLSGTGCRDCEQRGLVEVKIGQFVGDLYDTAAMLGLKLKEPCVF